MTRTLLLTLWILFVANSAFAQAGAICVYNDTSGNDCFLVDGAPGLVTYHVVQTLTAGSTAIQFSAPMPACMAGATWLGDTSPWPVTIGDSQSGVSVAYGSCQSATVYVLSINYQVAGTTPAACAYPVLPAPGESYIEVVDCAAKTSLINGGTTYFGGAVCECAEDPAPPILAVDKATLVLAAGAGTFNIENAGGLPLNWTLTDDAAWLTLLPTTVQVYFTVVDNSPPILNVSPTLLAYGTTDTLLTLNIMNDGGSVLEWTITENIPWFTPGFTSGSSGPIACTVIRAGLSPGFYTDSFTVDSNGGSETVAVTMEVPVPMPVLG